MEEMQIMEKVEKIIRGLFPKSNFTMNKNLTATEVDGWDSLSHARFLFAIENEFAIRIRLQDVERFHNIGELIDYIHVKTGGGTI